MSPLLFLKASRRRAFTLVQTMIAMGLMTFLLAAVYASGTSLLGSMKASENYSVGQLMAVDYMTLDLRRCQSYSLTPSGQTLTLPLTLQLPQYYKADGKTPNLPQRTLVTSLNKKDKKDHRIFSARYYYSYGTLGSTVQVTYSLSNGVLNRTEIRPNGSAPLVRAVGRNIQSVTFGPSTAAILADPVVTTKITFSPTQRSKQAPPPLSSTTFMREYYYSDY